MKGAIKRREHGYQHSIRIDLELRDPFIFVRRNHRGYNETLTHHSKGEPMFNNLKTKVSDFVNNPNNQETVKIVATYAAGIATYAVIIGVVGGIATVVQNNVVAASMKK
jgi:hypothetical protein